MKLLNRIRDNVSLSISAILRELLPPDLLRKVSRGNHYIPASELLTMNDVIADSNTPDTAGDLRYTINQVFVVMEVDQAETIVGDLFRRRFFTDSFPEEPRHFVGFAILPDKSLIALGYVHYIMWEGCALCGGLVIDERHYRRLSAQIRKAIHEAGGVAEQLLRHTFSRLRDNTIAIWGHVGSKQSEKVCLRVGFELTDSQYVMVAWNSSALSEAEKREWITRVTALGSF